MKDLNLTQGTAKWHAARQAHYCASEAAAMMGVGKYMTRSELLRQKATGLVPEISPHQQARFDQGHATEASARELIEQEFEDFYAITATDDDDRLLASVDGINLSEDTLFEHKLWNEELVAQMDRGTLSPAYYWQLEHQLYVTGAKKVLFVCSDGTAGKRRILEYRAVPGRVEQLLAGWKQFEEDLAAWQPPAVDAPKPIAAVIESLPALIATVKGEVVATNLEDYVVAARDFIQAINTDLQNDQDFEDAGAAVKFCKDSADKLKIVKQQALAQTESIDRLFRAVDQITSEFDQKRLQLDRLLKTRNDALRADIVTSGATRLTAHIKALNERLGQDLMPGIPANFAAAIKGKRNFASMREAVDSELTQAKLAANVIADRIQINLGLLDKNDEFRMLFSDLRTIVQKENDDFETLVNARVTKHKADEQARVDALAEEARERIRREEKERADREAADRLKAEAPAVATQIPAATPVATQKPAEVISKADAKRQQIPSRPKKDARPTDDAIVEVVALHYRISETTAIDWLQQLDLNAVRKRLATQFA